MISLLFLADPKNGLYRLLPLRIERRSIICLLPVSICQANGIAKRIQLIFTLVNTRFHLRMIAVPSCILRIIIIKGIGIRILQYKGSLLIDNAKYQ